MRRRFAGTRLTSAGWRLPAGCAWPWHVASADNRLVTTADNLREVQPLACNVYQDQPFDGLRFHRHFLRPFSEKYANVGSLGAWKLCEFIGAEIQPLTKFKHCSPPTTWLGGSFYFPARSLGSRPQQKFS